MRCVILQPSYIPWRGYFHQIHLADVFVFYDDVQYDRGSWRNRNRIKTRQGPLWLTIPVEKKGSVVRGTPLNEIRICWRTEWTRKHRMTIEQSYARAPHLRHLSPMLDDFYSRRSELLVDFNIELTIAIAERLGIRRTRFIRSSEVGGRGTRTERLLEILQRLGAKRYLSGPAARSYLDKPMLEEAGIEVRFMSYHYPEYPQLFPPFEPQLSILDLLLMTGPEASRYIWGPTPGEAPLPSPHPESGPAASTPRR